jgi:putative transferase (TIGR04331 family)
LRENARAGFYELQAAGILHGSPESAAKQVREVWSDVFGWWQTNRVQDAIRRFSAQFCKSPDQAHANIVNLLKEEH